MSDQSHAANGSVTSGSFLLVARSCERQTIRPGGRRRAQLVFRCYGEPARGPDGAMRPTALRAVFYAGTERPGRNRREHVTHLTSFPPSTKSPGVWQSAPFVSRGAKRNSCGRRRSGLCSPLRNCIVQVRYARTGCRVRRTLNAANASTIAVAKVAAAPTNASPQLKPSLAVTSSGGAA